MRNFKNKLKLVLCIAASLILAASFFASKIFNPGKRPAGTGYNVILLIIDDLRPDHLGCYGYRRNTSPHIDKLAGESCIFKNSFSDAAYTLPSTISILTSVYPDSHGVFHVYKDKLSPRIYTLPEIFGIYGYKTAWFSVLKEPHLDIKAGFGRGFQKAGNLGASLDETADILSWLEKNRGKKFFLAVDARSVHDYYDFFIKAETGKNFSLISDIRKVNEQYYLKLVEAARLGRPPFRSPELLQGNEELFDGNYREGKEKMILGLLDAAGRAEAAVIAEPLYRDFVKRVGPDHPNLLVESYDMAVRYTDEKLINPVLRKVKELKLYGKTIIIITADHGELLGEHGFYGHNHLLVDESLRVPLIIRFPCLRNPRSIKALAQGVDIMPTVLELTGLIVPSQVQGKSLVGLMCKTGSGNAREYVISEGESGKTIRSADWRLLFDYSGNCLLYNVVSDPGGYDNKCFKEEQVACRLKSALKAWEESLPSYRDQEYFFDPGVDKVAQERIRKTGYW
ncbi:MAG: sulfatase-like hydrolase/transferase [Candidatus Omnitrophica bacterium]|jgi:arylsulfatase A-like enzyme|nr:sulfatase-like hydrolase/transferase [Candidatus Omnitrophota bacterium]MDD3274297.1 sulfatase-like hydrolase/transferase [Candidatus Omnitrophota bacterium]MDD5078519.1 sulfatase-like hydrolase/transferase [Candidatus Omnitrophota bacterium]MDD5724798.1 sulfatase-like hydrolase/transferase [Candidatus Omnitrophota bacterium]